MVTGQYRSKCKYCGSICTDSNGNFHSAENCPAVEEVEYFADGSIKRVKKHASRNPQITSVWTGDCRVPRPHEFTVTTTGYPNWNPVQGRTSGL